MPLFVANWKMHGSADFVREWAAEFATSPAADADTQIAVCPPLPYLAAARAALPPAVHLGAQNVAANAEDGAHTGEVSARMLADVGCTFVIVGHSERRAQQQEDDALCAAKLRAATAAGLRPILCVGEEAATHAQGAAAAQAEVTAQLAGALATAAGDDDTLWQHLHIAYEPKWAIGSGKTPTAEEVQAMHAHLRQWLMQKTAAIGGKIPLLYGGSVSAANAHDLIGIPDVNGFLVGGASLKPHAFAAICSSLSPTL